MKKIDPVVRRETLYIAVAALALSVIMELVFLLLGYFDYTVPLGNLLGAGVGVLNFFLMGLGVQSAVGLDEKAAREKVKFSMTMRYLMIVVAAAIGIAAPCFNTAAALIPLFFNRVAVAARPLFAKFLGDADGENPLTAAPSDSPYDFTQNDPWGDYLNRENDDSRDDDSRDDNMDYDNAGDTDSVSDDDETPPEADSGDETDSMAEDYASQPEADSDASSSSEDYSDTEGGE